MKKKFKLTKFLSVFSLATVLCMGGILGVGCSLLDEKDTLQSTGNTSISAPIFNDETGIKTEFANSSTLKLFSAKPEVVETPEANYLSYQLKATVLPLTVVDPQVSWGTAFYEPQNAIGDIADYISIHVDPDDSTICEVRILAPFPGEPNLIVWCQSNDATAECEFIYEGRPTEIKFVGDGVVNNKLNLAAGFETDVSFELSNLFNDVSPEFNEFEITSIDVKGKFNVDAKYVTNGTVNDSRSIIVGNDDYASSFEYSWLANNAVDNGLFKYNATDFVSAAIEDGVLKVSTLGDESIVGGNSWTQARTGYAYKFNSNIEGEDLIIRITVKVINTDCEGYLYVTPSMEPNAIILNENTIYV